MTLAKCIAVEDSKDVAEWRHSVVPFLKTYPSVKIWVVGCTAEDLVGLPALLRAEGLGRFRIYVTDAKATIVRKMKKVQSEDLFFFQHNLSTDASFNEFQLIVCGDGLGRLPKKAHFHAHQVLLDSLPVFGLLTLSKNEVIPKKLLGHYKRVDGKSNMYKRIS